MIKNPLISTIIPVYNVEKYLRETIASVLQQNIGFRENIELILVNDGSTDNSGKICEEFAKKFPENVIYKKQKNAGVSVARNRGMKFMHGKYVHFLDSDDKISQNFYSESLKIFAKNREIDIVANKIIFFDAAHGEHYLNKKFKQAGVIDIQNNPEKTLLHLPTTLIKSSAAKKNNFDSRLKITEDAKFLNEVLFLSKKYGVTENATYYYRRRNGEESAIQGVLKNRSYYIETPHFAYEEMAKLWSDQKGKIYPYMANLLINDIGWRIKSNKTQHVLNKQEEKKYKKTIYNLVKKIDDENIIKSINLGFLQKNFLLKNKYSENFAKKVKYRDGKYFIGDAEIVDLKSEKEKFLILIDFIHEKKNGEILLEGFCSNDRILTNDKIIFRSKKGDFPVKFVERAARRKNGFLGDPFIKDEAFEVKIKFAENDEIQAIYQTANGDEFSLKIFPKIFTKISMARAYRITKDGTQIFRAKNQKIYIKKNNFVRNFTYEIIFWLSIAKSLRLRDTLRMSRKAISNFPRIRQISKKTLIFDLIKPFVFFLRNIFLNLQNIILRILFHMIPRSKKQIWILSDRVNMAGDNGEALFKFLNKQQNPNLKIYYTISRKSTDYKRMKKIGKVLSYGTFRYKFIFLRASKVISAHADDWVYNPFGNRRMQMENLVNYKLIFLQHGITKDDLSPWLNRFNKNISLIVTAARNEHDSFLKSDYYYKKNNVLLSGFPRYDLLENSPKNILMLAPTWRNKLTQRTNKSGVFGYSESFKNTDYFKFYNDLINDLRILSAMRKVGMKGKFYLHPAMREQKIDFTQNSVFEIAKLPYNYTKAFEESDILITDFSSVAFDFAYLKKPIIYTQFDKDDFFDMQVYDPGYFSYEKDGFGEVVYDYESAVRGIVNLIENGAKMSDKYLARVRKFYKFHDQKNCERVYKAILKLDKD